MIMVTVVVLCGGGGGGGGDDNGDGVHTDWKVYWHSPVPLTERRTEPRRLPPQLSS